MTFKHLNWIFALALGASLNVWASDDVRIEHAWVRASVPGQMASGAFMQLTALRGATLLGVTSALAGVAQVHEMKMENGVMKMTQVAGGLPLPAGQTVTLKPGGYHIMLMDLKQTLAAGSQVPITLHLRASDGHTQTLDVQVPALGQPPAKP